MQEVIGSTPIFSTNPFGVEIFDILTHKTVSKDFKLKTELYISINSQFTAESMSNQAACIDAIFYNL